jgi:hypothetical protein
VVDPQPLLPAQEGEFTAQFEESGFRGQSSDCSKMAASLISED